MSGGRPRRADDLAHIVEYIRKDNPASARRVAQVVYQGIARLRKFPDLGRIGLAESTRELVFSPWPYIAVYEILDDDIGASHPSCCAGLATIKEHFSVKPVEARGYAIHRHDNIVIPASK